MVRLYRTDAITAVKNDSNKVLLLEDPNFPRSNTVTPFTVTYMFVLKIMVKKRKEKEN